MALIILVGMTGAGKSTTGRRLAERLSIPFVDLDERIAARAGQSIAEFFSAKGEAAFRQIEQQCLAELHPEEKAVVAVGAGALQTPANREMIADSGVAVYLRVPVEELARRLDDVRDRPLLNDAMQGDALRSRLQDMLREREPHYLNADCVIDVREADSVDVIVERIERALQRA